MKDVSAFVRSWSGTRATFLEHPNLLFATVDSEKMNNKWTSMIMLRQGPMPEETEAKISITHKDKPKGTNEEETNAKIGVANSKNKKQWTE
jgi:hypothetical protein